MSESGQATRFALAGLVVAAAVGIGAFVAISQNDGDAGETAAIAPGQSTTTVVDDESSTDSSAEAGGEGTTTTDSNGSGETTTTTGSGETTTTGDGETTTTADQGSDAVVGPVDVLIGSSVIGGWFDGAWRTTPATPPSYDGVVFTHFTSPSTERFAGANTQPFCEFIPDAPGWLLEMDAPFDAIGVSNLTWDPRSDNARSTDISPDRAASVTAVLANAGLDVAAPGIDSATILDIDDDGTNEVILVANNGQPEFYGSRIGDYSTIVMRWVNESENVEEVVLSLHATTGNEPNAEPSPDAPEGVIGVGSTFYQVAGIADLNGDGDLEVVVEYFGWEFWGYQVIDVDGRNASVVLDISCGV